MDSTRCIQRETVDVPVSLQTESNIHLSKIKIVLIGHVFYSMTDFYSVCGRLRNPFQLQTTLVDIVYVIVTCALVLICVK